MFKQTQKFELWGNKFMCLSHPIRKIDRKPIILKELAILSSSVTLLNLGRYLRKELTILGVEDGIKSISTSNFVACGVAGKGKKPQFIVILRGLERPNEIITKLERII